MPPYKKCCECPCVGENCLQGYAAGCNHPCCYCEDIQGKTTCDDDYCSTLFACHTNQLSDTGCESITFDVSITYPGALPRRVVSGDSETSCGVDIVLDKIGELVQVTNAGLGVPPGVGDSTRTTPCARDECEDCTEPLCANCSRTGGISELSSGLVWPPRDYDTETSYVWPETGGIKTLTAENVGGCMWRGVAICRRLASESFFPAMEAAISIAETRLSSRLLSVTVRHKPVSIPIIQTLKPARIRTNAMSGTLYTRAAPCTPTRQATAGTVRSLLCGLHAAPTTQTLEATTVGD